MFAEHAGHWICAVIESAVPLIITVPGSREKEISVHDE
jgi:hypothetical protein